MLHNNRTITLWIPWVVVSTSDTGGGGGGGGRGEFRYSSVDSLAPEACNFIECQWISQFKLLLCHLPGNPGAFDQTFFSGAGIRPKNQLIP